jgi:hypothetical protein
LQIEAGNYAPRHARRDPSSALWQPWNARWGRGAGQNEQGPARRGVALTIRRLLHPQFDLFVPFIADLPLRDHRETMERPFFSLAKRKRLKLSMAA